MADNIKVQKRNVAIEVLFIKYRLNVFIQNLMKGYFFLV